MKQIEEMSEAELRDIVREAEERIREIEEADEVAEIIRRLEVAPEMIRKLVGLCAQVGSKRVLQIKWHTVRVESVLIDALEKIQETEVEE